MYQLTTNGNSNKLSTGTITVETTNPTDTQSFTAPNDTYYGVAIEFVNQVNIPGYSLTRNYDYDLNKGVINFTATSSGVDQPDMTMTITESGFTDMVNPVFESLAKVQDGSAGSAEQATATFSGTTGSGNITVQVGAQSFPVAVIAGDSATTVANKVFAVIGANGVAGYTAVNNGDGTITFTSTTQNDVTDLIMNVTN